MFRKPSVLLANAGPWKKLAERRGAVVKSWLSTPTSPNNPYSLSLKIQDLLPLITSKTRIVAFTACSNILGTATPVKEITKAVREEAKLKGAKKVEISIDCVAYAPHRRMDVQDWDIDFCVFSFYKVRFFHYNMLARANHSHQVYGTHTSALYVRSSALKSSVTPIVHHFLKSYVGDTGYRLQPGGPGYELVYGTTAIIPYLLSLTSAGTLEASFDAIAAHERTLVEPLLAYLTHPDRVAKGVRVVGEEEVNLQRLPTISFVVVGEHSRQSRDIVKVFDQKGGVSARLILH